MKTKTIKNDEIVSNCRQTFISDDGIEFENEDMCRAHEQRVFLRENAKVVEEELTEHGCEKIDSYWHIRDAKEWHMLMEWASYFYGKNGRPVNIHIHNVHDSTSGFTGENWYKISCERAANPDTGNIEDVFSVETIEDFRNRCVHTKSKWEEYLSQFEGVDCKI